MVSKLSDPRAYLAPPEVTRELDTLTDAYAAAYPTSPSAYQARARICEAAGLAAEAASWTARTHDLTPDSRYHHGFHLWRSGRPELEAEALEWFRRAAAGGHGLAHDCLGTSYRWGVGVEPNLDTALDWYQRAAALGVPRSMIQLGEFYRLGLGVEKDAQQAATWHQRAAAKGWNQPLFELARLYLQGTGLERDPKQAREYAQRAAQRGYKAACVLYGRLLEKGVGGEQDGPSARYWYDKVGARTYPDALFALGRADSESRDLFCPDVLARRWYLEAARYGHAGAMAELARMALEPTRGLERDEVEGRAWQRRAAAAGETASSARSHPGR